MVLSAVLTPLSALLLSLISSGQKIASLLIQFLLVFLQQASDLLDGLSCCLHLMVLVHAVDGTLWADRFVARKAKVSEFFFCVIRTWIFQLISSFFGVGAVRRL